MKTKYIIITVLITIIFSGAQAQFSMDNRARITLTSNTTDWTSAFRTYVPTHVHIT